MSSKTSSAITHSVSVPIEAAGARLDKWLSAAVTDVSRSRLKTLIEEGAVAVAGKTIDDPAYRLRAEQMVTLRLPAAIDATPAAQGMDLDIAYEDDDLIVVNKPVGLVVHPAPGNLDKTLVNALLAHCGDSLAGIGGVKRPGIVHRIDKDTSGLLVAAKTEAAHAGLSAQFAARTIVRSYDAVVWGVPSPDEGDIIGAIGRSRHNRKKMAILQRGGKEAETGYRTIATFGEIAAHLRCRLRTGRTHQIRVHMAAIGHPLIGDATYGSNRRRSMKGVPPETAALLKGFRRQALHATTLGFEHPVTAKTLRFEAPLPEDLDELLAALADYDEVFMAQED
jgi:23S rRNA pseudouridine1911/1915/1917 synthase